MCFNIELNGITINATQHRILQRLLVRPYRTDELGQVLDLRNNEVSAQLLPLRTAGFVITINDGGLFVKWQVTDELRAYLTKMRQYAEEEERRKAEAQAKRNEYILWQPESNMPPKVRFATLAEAQKAQRSMAEKHTGKTFYICEVQKGLRASRQTEFTEV